jgi:hypothetical protein
MSAPKTVFFALLAAVSLLSVQAFAQPHISGTLSGTLGPGSYIVDGDCQVLLGDSLTILPGTEFLHVGHYSWLIYGKLTAEGAEGDSILFIRQSPYPTYRWGGIRFTPTVPVQSILNYCVIEDVYNGTDILGGGIYVEGNYITVRNTRISSCQTVEDGAGIYAYYGTMLLVEDCQIDRCTADIGGGIYLNLSSGAQVKNCAIVNNTCTGT